MEARAVDNIPSGPEWQYEPKWDGFRCLAFREGKAVELQSKSGQPLARYFPEIVVALQALRPTKFVLDGEIVIPVKGELSFDELLLRIHPAASRVNKLAKEHPGVFIAFGTPVVPKGGRSTRRDHRQASRFALPVWRTNRHAEDQETAFRRLRCGWVSICQCGQGDWVVIVRFVRPQGALTPCRIHFEFQSIPAEAIDTEDGSFREISRFHGPVTRRTKPLVNGSFCRVATTVSKTCGGSPI